MRVMLSYPFSYSMSFDWAFNPFMFNVIIDRYSFIAIFSYLSSSLSLTAVLPVLKADPLACLGELVLRRCLH